MKNTARTRSDCNWMVVQAQTMHSKLRDKRLAAVTDLEDRIRIKIEIRNMDWNELNKAMK